LVQINKFLADRLTKINQRHLIKEQVGQQHFIKDSWWSWLQTLSNYFAENIWRPSCLLFIKLQFGKLLY